ncbi:hypothetical protein MIR68_010493 [Amoeboaphelidium protococcarum]|nr:hypothetical protein MIR68_010493 [Amoeboaphelidium protococcarum]
MVRLTFQATMMMSFKLDFMICLHSFIHSVALESQNPIVIVVGKATRDIYIGDAQLSEELARKTGREEQYLISVFNRQGVPTFNRELQRRDYNPLLLVKVFHLACKTGQIGFVLHYISDQLVPNEKDHLSCAFLAIEFQQLELYERLNQQMSLQGGRLVLMAVVRALKNGISLENFQKTVLKLIASPSVRLVLLRQILTSIRRPDASAWLTSHLLSNRDSAQYLVNADSLRLVVLAHHWETVNSKLTDEACAMNQFTLTVQSSMAVLDTEAAITFAEHFIAQVQRTLDHCIHTLGNKIQSLRGSGAYCQDCHR